MPTKLKRTEQLHGKEKDESSNLSVGPMGKIYKRKRRSCPLCKPHKTGGADKLTPRERQEANLAEEEMREAMGCMEHHCNKCEFVVINNDPKQRNCPNCGAPMYRLCDEIFEGPDGDDHTYSFEDPDDENDYGRWGSED